MPLLIKMKVDEAYADGSWAVFLSTGITLGSSSDRVGILHPAATYFHRKDSTAPVAVMDRNRPGFLWARLSWSREQLPFHTG